MSPEREGGASNTNSNGPAIHAGGEGDLAVLDPDHPGFRDAQYRARRNLIARIALEHRTGGPVVPAPYTEEEHGLWRHIRSILDPLHEVRICAELLDLQRVFPLARDRIPQLRDLNPRLAALTGYSMEPVAGLVSPRTFMSYLGRKVFLSTQYIRHGSRPLYTPEPDVVHELVGHAATLAHPKIAEVNRLLGAAAQVATADEMHRLDHMYWYTMEFGVVAVAGGTKAFGAGLLSSCGELRDYDAHARFMEWDLDRIAVTPFDPTTYQPHVYVAPSFDRMLDDVAAWVRTGRWRDEAWQGRDPAAP